MGNKFVPNAHPSCEQSGCEFGKGLKVAAEAMAAMERMRRPRMAAARWCDLGEHSFSPRDKDARIQKEIDPDGNEEEMEVCGPCLKAAREASRARTTGADAPKRIVLTAGEATP